MEVRDATDDDVAVLTEIKEPAVLHQDRMRDAGEGAFRYLVITDDSHEIVGHACLLFRRPRSWPPDEGDTPYPRVIDLMIRKDRRGVGLGRSFMAQMEAICADKRCGRLHLSVDPQHNTEALHFYAAIGYNRLRQEPRWSKWSFKDSSGKAQRGEGFDLEMFKDI